MWLIFMLVSILGLGQAVYNKIHTNNLNKTEVYFLSHKSLSWHSSLAHKIGMCPHLSVECLLFHVP